MRIEAAGKTWIVEEEELSRASWGGGGRFSGVRFKSASDEPDELQVSWVLTPERLTPRIARELFEIAGVRLWRDPRNSRSYRLAVESNAARPRRGRPAALEILRFESADLTVEAPWTLDRPLGCATDADLMRLLDEATRTGDPLSD